MAKNSLSVTQVVAVTKIENLISILYNDPEYFFEKITQSIDEHKIAENEEIMNYLHNLLAMKGYIEYAEKFAKKYNIQN